ncbi:MAG: helix-turn-helix domain-containing protein [Burkholderiaceae bacterium]|nr:helix-turn-helix domain-containing protein [Burkholderiaceae bacterium]
MNEIVSALNEAICKAGGLAAFSAGIGAPSSGAVKQWRISGSIPADYCPAIERITGVVCERLRPKVDWGYLRGNLIEKDAIAIDQLLNK